MQYCIFNCFTSNTTRVTEINPGHVAVTNVNLVEFICKNASMNSKYSTPSRDGAISIKIPCFCKAIINEEITVKSAFPCQNEHKDPLDKIIHIIPVQWSLLR